MLDSFSVTYGEIRGIFSAYASLSFKDAPYIQYTFDFQYLEKLETIQATLEAYAVTWASAVRLTPLPAWKETLQPTLEFWLCDSLMVPTSTKKYWSQVVTNLLNKIEQLVQPTAIWRVEIDEKSFYELLWEDFALENEHAAFFLHLGFSD